MFLSTSFNHWRNNAVASASDGQLASWTLEFKSLIRRWLIPMTIRVVLSTHCIDVKIKQVGSGNFFKTFFYRVVIRKSLITRTSMWISVPIGYPWCRGHPHGYTLHDLHPSEMDIRGMDVHGYDHMDSSTWD